MGGVGGCSTLNFVNPFPIRSIFGKYFHDDIDNVALSQELKNAASRQSSNFRIYAVYDFMSIDQLKVLMTKMSQLKLYGNMNTTFENITEASKTIFCGNTTYEIDYNDKTVKTTSDVKWAIVIQTILIDSRISKHVNWKKPSTINNVHTPDIGIDDLSVFCINVNGQKYASPINFRSAILDDRKFNGKSRIHRYYKNMTSLSNEIHSPSWNSLKGDHSGQYAQFTFLFLAPAEVYPMLT